MLKKMEINFIKTPEKPFISNGGLKGIKICKLFFKFNQKEKIAILWHEFFHCRLTYIPKNIWLELKYCFGNKESFWEEEYGADKFSALNNNIQDCLSYLKRCKYLYNKKTISYNFKTHPSIVKRIEEIKKLMKNQ